MNIVRIRVCIIRHYDESRSQGPDMQRTWIPAYAGMTYGSLLYVAVAYGGRGLAMTEGMVSQKEQVSGLKSSPTLAISCLRDSRSPWRDPDHSRLDSSTGL
jgi:hypothetical protein